MRRICSFVLGLMFFTILLPLYAQEEDGEEESPPEIITEDPDWEGLAPTLYSEGDKTFIITLGLLLPTYFGGDSISGNRHNLRPLGGTGSLAFNYFMSPHIFWGVELGGMFLGTRGENMFFMVPFGLRVGYQFIFRRFEFPLTLMIGGAPQKYLEKGYFGFILKPEAAVFWRFNPDWSFGFNTNWWFVPQRPKNGKNAIGNFIELTFSARYHF
ncbi:MAG: hypothetical protein LBL43_00065 [Treponema sp.]|jgi:hypothetical protein|nr:hypothetical protein [Treponema sp.]